MPGPYGKHDHDGRHQDPQGSHQPPDRGSVDLIVQVKRLRDGSRRTTNVTEVIGMEGDVIVTQELFKFEYLDESEDGKIIGEFRSTGLRPYTLEKARQFGFDQAYLDACL
jgi:pilus assembly protein CpaF